MLRLLFALLFFSPVLCQPQRAPSCDIEVVSSSKTQLVKDCINHVKTIFPKCRDGDEDLTKCSKRDSALTHLDLALNTLDDLLLKDCPTCPDIEGGASPEDCAAVYRLGYRRNGVYTIYPQNTLGSLRVYCDMTTDGGGWTIIQRRGNFSTQTNFFQDWETYKKGFGVVERDFWLGNDNIYIITNQDEYSLRIDMRDHTGVYKYSLHDIFRIGDETSQYVLYLEGYRGTAPDDLSSHHNQMFWTKDRKDNQRDPNVDQCPIMYHGAWWYLSYNCGYVNLNGMYLYDNNGDRSSNWWWNWTGYKGLHFIEMKVRPKNFVP